jgi:tetratricopeptide (TPR) repeat protein
MFRWIVRILFIALMIAGVSALLSLDSSSEFLTPFMKSPSEKERTIANTQIDLNEKKTLPADHLNLIYNYLLGEYFQSKNDSINAAKSLKKAVQSDPESAHLQLSWAETQLKMGNVKEGIEAAKKAHDLDTNNREATLLLVNVYVSAKKHDKARTLLKELLKKNNSDEEVVLMDVLVDVEDQNTERAYQNLKKYLKTDPSSANGFFYLGRLEQNRGFKNKAIEAFEKAMELKPSFVQAATYLALLLEDAGKKDRALSLYKWLADETDDVSFHKKLGKIMWDKCGMARNEKGLMEAIVEIAALREEFWKDVRIPGSQNELNLELEKAMRVADFIELGELMCKDALHRKESCGGHFREEYQTEDGEAKRDDDNFTYAAAWEMKSVGVWELHKEDLNYQVVHPTQRSYK